MFHTWYEAKAKCDDPQFLPSKSLSQQGRQISLWTLVFQGEKFPGEVDIGISWKAYRKVLRLELNVEELVGRNLLVKKWEQGHSNMREQHVQRHGGERERAWIAWLSTGCVRGHKRSAGEVGTHHPQNRRDLGTKVLGFLWTVVSRH